jgi:DNA-binding NtrC family response regulator
MACVLLVDDEQSILNVLRLYLEKSDFSVLTADSAREALEVFGQNHVDLMIVDLRLGEGMDGLELMHECRLQRHDLPVIMITAYGAIEVAVQAMKEGAYDFICKPFDFGSMLKTIQDALGQKSLLSNTAAVDGPAPLHFDSLVGESEEMQSIYRIVQRVAPTNTTVLIQGESGTGKELIAQAIHAVSKRANGPLVALNCAAIPSSLLESEMFGHAAGAFTGATGKRDGLFMEAHRGTLFLDEIGVMDIALQGKLLRALQEGVVRRVGENKDIPIDVRVLAATNESLKARMESGDFREDLYYRLSVIPIELPPLRRRKEDLPLLIKHFCHRQSQALGRTITCDGEVMQALTEYSWPGNVRELQNAIACAATLSDDGCLKIANLPPNIIADRYPDKQSFNTSSKAVDLGKSLRDFLREKEQEYLELVLARTGGNRAKAADLLGISRATFYRKFPETNPQDAP